MPSSSMVIENHISAFNARDEPSEPWADDAHMVAPGGADITGRAGVLAFLRVFHNAFSNGRLQLVRLISDGDNAAVEGVFEGTHDGPLASPNGDVPATGRSVSFRWAAVYEIAGETLKSEHLFFDQADFLAQLGLG